MLSYIQTNLVIQQTNLPFKGRGKDVRNLITNPEQMRKIKSIIHNSKLSKTEKEILLKAEALQTPSSIKDLLNNILANLKLMFTKNK